MSGDKVSPFTLAVAAICHFFDIEVSELCPCIYIDEDEPCYECEEQLWKYYVWIQMKKLIIRHGVLLQKKIHRAAISTMKTVADAAAITYLSVFD